MPVESAADRATFLNPDEFGEQLTWSGGSLAGIPSTGTFALDGKESAGALNRRCALLCRVADIGFSRGASVTFRSATHTVKAIEPDGTGMALVRLEKA
jgi:hypothetical protein